MAAFTQLQKLYMNDTKITDSGLKNLGALKRLQILGLRLTKVTDAGALELKKAFPKLVIVR
jgi:hypothetical protein